jgi:hypothetical protein
MLLLISLFLIGCEKSSISEVIEFGDYDLTNLTTCLGSMMDEDEETVCSLEDGESYLTAYADYFIQYLDPAATINVNLSYGISLQMFIDFSNLPTQFGKDSIDVMNQVTRKINSDVSSIILNDLGYIIDFKADITFSGIEITGLFENYDILSFYYIHRQGTPEIYVADLRYYEDTELTTNFNERLDRLEEVLEEQDANRFRVQLSNGTEVVMVDVNKISSEYSITVRGEGNGNTTELTAADFLSQVEERFPDYTYLTSE